MKSLLLMTTLVCAGCLVVPKTTTTTTDLGVVPGEVVHGSPQRLTLRSAFTGTIIEVRATAERACSRELIRRTEVRAEKTASYRGNKDARLGPLALVLAPLTIPVSAIATGLVVLADGSGSRRVQSARVRTERFACTTVAADVALAIQLPSGASVTATTNEDGLAHVPIPESEPYTGVVTVTAADTSARTALRYARAMPAIASVRETVVTCASMHHVAGRVRVELGIDQRGRAARIGLDAGDGLFAACVNDGLAGTRFSAAHHGVKLVLPFEL